MKLSSDTKSTQNTNSRANNNLVDLQHSVEEQFVDKGESNKANKANKTAIVGIATKPIEMKLNQKPQIAYDAANKTIDSNIINNNNSNNINTSNSSINAIAPKISTKESTKKKVKDKDQKAVEEKKRQQEEEERQQTEEKKRLDLIAAQRKAKLVDQNALRNEQTTKRNNLAASVGKQ